MKCTVQTKGKRCGQPVYAGQRYCLGHLVRKLEEARRKSRSEEKKA